LNLPTGKAMMKLWTGLERREVYDE
jgi:hypothetical protein